jgi:hypothetical protein
VPVAEQISELDVGFQAVADSEYARDERLRCLFHEGIVAESVSNGGADGRLSGAMLRARAALIDQTASRKGESPRRREQHGKCDHVQSSVQG